MFTINDKFSKAMKPIAEALFVELQAFGQFGIWQKKLSQETLEIYIKERAGFILSFLKTLELAANLQFRAQIPYCYYTYEWPTDVAIAGYTQTQRKPLPSQVTTSLVLNWEQKISGASNTRLLCAALWLCLEHDFDFAINYLFDLLKQGFVLDYEDLVQIVVILCYARSQVASDKEMVQRLFGGKIPETTTDWFETDFTTDWVDTNDLSSSVKTTISSLLSKSLQVIENVRNANNWDEWLVGQSVLYGYLSSIREIIGRTSTNLSLAAKSVLSQQEEIIADSGGFFRARKAGYGGHPFRSISFFRSANQLGRIFQKKIGEGWESHFLQKRLLIPAQLYSHWFNSDMQALPVGWDFLSWRLIHPFSTIITLQLPLGLMPLDYKHTDFELYEQELMQGIESAVLLIDRGMFTDGIGQLELLQHQYPWCGPIYSELAIAFDKSGDPQKALDYIIPAIVLDPHIIHQWQSLAVILDRLSYSDEANLALAMKRVIL